MSRLHILRLSLGALMLVLLAALAPAVGAAPPGPQGAAAWTGEYYNNVSLAGAPAYVRDDPAINFYWPQGTSPVPGWVNTDHYSIRWTRYLNFSTGNWTFTTVNDDGMRVWVDNQITVDAWYDQGPTTHTGTIYLNAGWHLVRVEYYNRTLGGTAQVSWAQQGAITQWKGQYFNNQSLSGSPVLVRNDANVNFDWGYGSPDPSVPSDHFSARWTRTLNLSAGTYRVTVTSDDGVRVWVDGNLVIDQWHDQPPTTYSNDIALGAGNHTFKIEYYEDRVTAQISFSYQLVSPPPPGGAWRGQYFNNMYLAGAPVFVRNDAAVNFNWGTGSPDPRIPADYFSVAWDSTVNFGASGNYNIVATSDDGVRVWVDGVRVIDAWYDHAPTTYTVTRYLSAGGHAIHIEYYEHTGGAMISVQIGGTPPPPPSGDVIVDDRGAGWQAGGCSSCWRDAWTGYGNHAFWTYNNTYVVEGYDWARWYPNLPHAGSYEVFAYIPAGLGNTTDARYWIKHSGQYNLAALNQGRYANQWVSLGTYYFADTSDENVSLTDVTYEAYLSHTIVFDAMKFSPR
jgi:PA14 domain